MIRCSRFLSLPREIRRMIYQDIFETTQVHADFSFKPRDGGNADGTIWPYRPWWEHPSCNIHQDLSITFVSRAVRRESLPLFFKFALFDLGHACTSFLAEGHPNIPLPILQKMHRIRGNYDLLTCLRLAFRGWMQRVPWPQLNVHALPFSELYIDLSLSSPLISAGLRSGCSPYTDEIRSLLRRPRKFYLELRVTVRDEVDNIQFLVHISNDLVVAVTHILQDTKAAGLLSMTAGLLGLQVPQAEGWVLLGDEEEDEEDNEYIDSPVSALNEADWDIDSVEHVDWPPV